MSIAPKKVIPSAEFPCEFTGLWLYKRRLNSLEVLVLDVPMKLKTWKNPIEDADFRWTAATTDTHHTFVGRVIQKAVFFMN